jgi:hypothetical protein
VAIVSVNNISETYETLALFCVGITLGGIIDATNIPSSALYVGISGTIIFLLVGFISNYWKKLK